MGSRFFFNNLDKRGGRVMLRKILSIVILLVVAGFVVGCGGGEDGEDREGKWDMPTPVITGVDPLVGTYSFSPRGCFEVIAESGKKYVIFASECWKSDKITVSEGTFYNEWGAIGGTHCPTDGYAISGSFNSATTAVGTIKYASDCKILSTESFEAILK